MSVNWLNGFLLTALIFVPLERLLARRPQRIFRRGWFNDVTFLLLNPTIINFALGLVIISVSMAAVWLMPVRVRDAVASQPYWIQIVEILVAADIGFYLAHRAFHTFPWLWKFHEIHHSIEELDWLAATRVHPVDQIITKACSFFPVFTMGFSDLAIGVFVFLYSWQSILVHSNLRINFGPLRWLLASPEFHHWHHSKDREARDKNFAGQLPFLDVLFGTAYMPGGKMPTGFGLDQPIPKSYPAQLIHPFRRIATSSVQTGAADATLPVS